MADGESTWRARRGEYGCGYTSVATVLGAEVVAGAAVLHIEHKYLFVLDCISLHHTYTHTSSSSRSSTTAATAYVAAASRVALQEALRAHSHSEGSQRLQIMRWCAVPTASW